MPGSSLPTVPRSAVTLIIAGRHGEVGPVAGGRRGAEADYRIFMVKRAYGQGFMGGAHVFPGGVLDPADSDPRWAGLLDGAAGDFAPKERALRLCGVRETFEESGILVAGGPGGARISLLGDLSGSGDFRGQVHDDARRFHGLCVEHGVRPRLDRLLPWSRWVTPTFERRRFDARFYLVGLDELPAATHDNGETISSGWFTPGEAIDLASQRKIFLPPPTWYTLGEMRPYRRLRDLLLAAGRGRDLAPIQPRLIAEPTCLALILPGDSAHPDRPGEGPSARHRIEVGNGGHYRLVSTKKRPIANTKGVTYPLAASTVPDIQSEVVRVRTADPGPTIGS